MNMFLTAYRRTGFATRVTVACALGALLGLALGPKAAVLQPAGEVFIRLLRTLVVPVVVTTLLAGLSAPSPAGIGRLGAKAVGWCLGFSIVATAVGLLSAIWLRPGLGLPIPEATAMAALVGVKKIHTKIATLDGF
jgi:Na+/H+-dicarboxylate symporter